MKVIATPLEENTNIISLAPSYPSTETPPSEEDSDNDEAFNEFSNEVGDISEDSICIG